MPTRNIIRALQHIALTIEQATGLEPSSIAGLTGIWGQVNENPESLDDPAVRDMFVTAVNQVLPEFSLSRNPQWQALWRGTAQQTQITARRFAGVDNQALIPLRDWLIERLGADHALFVSQEWQNMVQSGSKPQALLELRHELLLVTNVDLLECPDLPELWRLFLQKSVDAEYEEDLRTQQRAAELRSQPRTKLTEYGKALFDAPPQAVENIWFARRLATARASAVDYIRNFFGPVPLELVDVLAKTSWYLDQLSRGNYAEAAQALSLMSTEQVHFGTLMILQQDLNVQHLGEFELLVPFEFDYVGIADRALRPTHLSPEEWEAVRQDWRADGLSELEILSWESLVELSDVRSRLEAFAWAMEYFHEDVSREFTYDMVRVHKLSISFAEREANLQAAAQEKWHAMGGGATFGVDWVPVFFYVHYQRLLGQDVAKANKFQQKAAEIYPDKGLARYTSLNQATQNFLDEQLCNGWREWFPVSTLETRSALVRLGEVLVNAEAAQEPMNPDFFARLFKNVSEAPELVDFHKLPAHIFSFLAQGEYYFYLVANQELERAQAVHQQIGDAVIYLAASLRFQAFPAEVVLEDGSRLLIPQSSEGQLLISFGVSATEGSTTADPVTPNFLVQIGGFFYDGLLRSAIMGAVVGELLPVVNEPGAKFLRAFAGEQVETFVQEAREVITALQDYEVDLSQAVQAYLETQPASARTHWERALLHLSSNIQEMFPAVVSSPAGEESVPVSPGTPSTGQTFAPQVDPRMQELLAKLGRGTSSVLPTADFFPATVTTSEPLHESLLQLQLPGFTAPEVSVALPSHEAIKPEDLPVLLIERSAMKTSGEAAQRMHKLVSYYAQQQDLGAAAFVTPDPQLAMTPLAASVALQAVFADFELAAGALRLLSFAH